MVLQNVRMTLCAPSIYFYLDQLVMMNFDFTIFFFTVYYTKIS